VSERERMPLLERAGVGVAGIALAAVLIALLSGYFTNHDPGTVRGAVGSVGSTLADQGDRLLAPGELRPLYDSNPPTSGAHIRSPVTRQLIAFNDDQILTALASGNVLVLYGTAQAAAGLAALARRLAAPFTPALAAAGQAVILGRRQHLKGVVALAWTHVLRQARPNRTALTRFVDRWLGLGAR
jgi:hypothetical protein